MPARRAGAGPTPCDACIKHRQRYAREYSKCQARLWLDGTDQGFLNAFWANRTVQRLQVANRVLEIRIRLLEIRIRALEIRIRALEIRIRVLEIRIRALEIRIAMKTRGTIAGHGIPRRTPRRSDRRGTAVQIAVVAQAESCNACVARSTLDYVRSESFIIRSLQCFQVERCVHPSRGAQLQFNTPAHLAYFTEYPHPLSRAARACGVCVRLRVRCVRH